MTGNDLPVFGPTGAIPCDEDREPFATVRMDLIVTREQLRAALGIGHAEQAGQPALDEMSVQDIRREVERHLGACAVIQLDDEAGSFNARLAPELAAQLDAAIDRAYTVRETRRRMQNPEYGDGWVAVDTLDHGRVTMPEPAWCTGHDELQAQMRVDTCHFSAETAAEYAGTEFLPVCFSQAPFSAVQPQVMGDVADFPGMSPDEMRALAAEVAAHSGRLYSKANELDRIRRRQA